jgi:hypothetical protein
VGTITIIQESKALAFAKLLGVSGSWMALPVSPETYAGLRAARPGEPMADRLENQHMVGSLPGSTMACVVGPLGGVTMCSRRAIGWPRRPFWLRQLGAQLQGTRTAETLIHECRMGICRTKACQITQALFETSQIDQCSKHGRPFVCTKLQSFCRAIILSKPLLWHDSGWSTAQGVKQMRMYSQVSRGHMHSCDTSSRVVHA